jgi:hypothetical protein
MGHVRSSSFKSLTITGLGGSFSILSTCVPGGKRGPGRGSRSPPGTPTSDTPGSLGGHTGALPGKSKMLPPKPPFTIVVVSRSPIAPEVPGGLFNVSACAKSSSARSVRVRTCASENLEATLSLYLEEMEVHLRAHHCHDHPSQKEEMQRVCLWRFA